MANPARHSKATMGDAGELIVNGGTKPVSSIGQNTGNPGPKAPADYQTSSTQVDQFWVEADGPIHGKLVAAKPYVNKLNQKMNKIYIFDLADPCTTATSKGEKFDMYAQRRQIVGVWGCPGMRELDNLGGCFVWMVRDGEKDLGRVGQKPMKMYNIQFKGNPQPLRMIRGEVIDASGSDAQEAADQSANGLPF